jgi:glycyl-tRNA synthetase alpha chain
MVTFTDLIRRLSEYWSAQGCAILQPWDGEMGAGTMHPATVLGSLGPDPVMASYVQPSRRPADGRYTRNPMRSQRYYQYQVLLKPSPEDVVDLYLGSLNALGFDVKQDDVRLVEDDWESPSLGAAGVGWEIWINGTEISQFTFFQQMGGIECRPVCAELTYGPERLCLMLNGQNSFWDGLMWDERTSYREVDYQQEMQNNVFNFEVASVEVLWQLFSMYEAESKRVIETPVRWDASVGILTSEPGERAEEAPMPQALVYPALELALKCSHAFNLLDARGAVSSSQRADLINRVRALVRACCLAHVGQSKKG